MTLVNKLKWQSYNIYIIQWQSKEFNSYKWQLLRSEHMGGGNIWLKGVVGDLDICFGITNTRGGNKKNKKQRKTKQHVIVQRSLPHSITMTEVSLSKVTNPNCSPGAAAKMAAHCSVCVFTTVCALGWVKCRAQTQSMGRHTWPHITSLFNLPT